LKEYKAQASQEDDRGNLPLHYAVQNWWNVDVLKKIVEANPEALFALDGETRLPPALMAATKARFNCTYDVSRTFELLLAAPQIVGQSLAN
jgi:hypothetical protein